jgi:hypothetical protein
MSNKAKAAFNVLGAHANWETGECFLTVSTIAKEAGYQRRAIFYAINELENLGAIIVKRKLGEVNHYLIVHYQTGIPTSFPPQTADLSARHETAGAEDDDHGRQAGGEELAPYEDCESQRQNGNGGKLQGQDHEEATESLKAEVSSQLERPLENKEKTTLSVTDVHETSVEQRVETKKQQKGITLSEKKEAEPTEGQQKQNFKEEKPQASEVIHKEENKKNLIIGGMHINATPRANTCTPPCINLHYPVHSDAPKQIQANGNVNFPYKNTQPPVDKWYRELEPQQQTFVLCCTKEINKLFKSVLGNFIPPLFIMEKLMVGFEPQFLIKIIQNCNAPMILNPIGWFRDIQPWWHVKGETPEEYWKRMADFGMKPFFGVDLEEEGESTAIKDKPERSEEVEPENANQAFDDTQRDEGINYDGTLSPRAKQTIKLMNQYNSILADANLVYSLAQEEEATDEEKVDLIFHYHELRDKGKKVLDRIEEFGYFYNQEQMEGGFVLDEVTIKLKEFRD